MSLLWFPNPRSYLELRVPCTVTRRRQPVTQQRRRASAPLRRVACIPLPIQGPLFLVLCIDTKMEVNPTEGCCHGKRMGLSGVTLH